MTVTAPVTPLPRTERRSPLRRRAGWLVRALGPAAEIAAATFAALLMVWLGRRLHLDPMERLDQVSALAAIQLRLLVLLAAAVTVYSLAARFAPHLALRVSAGFVAGLATGVTGAGQVFALRGTTWPLYAQWGDAGQLQMWADGLLHSDGTPPPAEYPPGFPHLLAFTAQHFFSGDVPHAMKWLMIFFVALSGPAGYLAWRLLLPPLWALGVGVTATLPVVDPYKSYSQIVLVVVIPVVGKLVQVIQRSGDLSRRRAAGTGAGLGVLLAALFLLYAGWFVWSSIGAVVAVGFALYLVTREAGRRGLLTALVVLGATAAAFLLVAGRYLVSLLSASGATKDTYLYFDTFTDPAYFAMWGGTYPGAQRTAGLPPLGELGGVGLFTIVLVAGLGVALALGIRQAAVLSTAACTASAFLLRYWYASQMSQEKLVQLYPRTSVQIMYCLVALCGLAALVASERVSAWARGLGEAAPVRIRRRPVARRAVAVGALSALGLLFGLAGSATANAYLPEHPDKNSVGQYSWVSHVIRQSNGKCPKYMPKGSTCEPYVPPKRATDPPKP
ncbi:hypothetical protein AB0K43_03985 [Kitasatospora sp. NPDC049258]|uniref:hypothetical protein n=1 Tax=Kitasatospora sp. NPDC049258 TaxID=3155394 RepID=UPI00342B42D8